MSRRVLIACMSLVVGAIALATFLTWQERQRMPADLQQSIVALKLGQYRDAIEKIRPLAVGGHPLAQQLLGEMFVFGQGVPKDPVQATAWLNAAKCKCRNLGEAEYWIAVDYIDREKNSAAAFEWIVNSARLGFEPARKLLAGRTIKYTNEPRESKLKELIIPNEVRNYWQEANAYWE